MLELVGCVPQEEWRGEIEQLSWKPRAFLVKGFLSEEECNHIKDMVSLEPLEQQQQVQWALLQHAWLQAGTIGWGVWDRQWAAAC